MTWSVQALSPISEMSLYILVGLIGAMTMLIWGWQFRVLNGHAMSNPDGSADNWQDQKILYGLAFADVFLACPVAVLGIGLIFLAPQWGIALLAMISFWMTWINLATTMTSLRFEKPALTPMWIIVYPLGIVVGLCFLAWTIVHFDFVFGAT